MSLRLSHYLTLGRTHLLYVEFIEATIPILFALLLKTPPRFFGHLSVFWLGILTITLLVVYFCVSTRVLIEAGQSTYSPELHRWSFAWKSALAHLALALIFVLIGYTVLIQGRFSTLLNWAQALTGAIITLLYALLAVVAHTSSIISPTRQAEKQRIVDSFFESTANIREGQDILVNAQTIDNCGEELYQRLSDEPVVSQNLTNTFREWLSKFQDCHGSGKRKMVGGLGEADELSEPWKSHYHDFAYVSKELSIMGSQSE